MIGKSGNRAVCGGPMTFALGVNRCVLAHVLMGRELRLKQFRTDGGVPQKLKSSARASANSG